MNKFFLSLLVGVFLNLSVSADEINKYIKNQTFGVGSTVAVHVLDNNNNKVIYKKNENKSLNPASILKVLTFGASYDVLGEDYIFETGLYQDEEKNIYIKLGGDVLLNQDNLNLLVGNLKDIDFKEIYIDDSIFDKEKYPNSWIDEDKWPNQRMISPYIIDGNFVDVAINRSSLAKKVDIIQENEYKIAFINELSISDVHNIEIKRNYGDDSLIVNLTGTVAKDDVLHLPVLKPEINFNIKLNKALDKNKIIHSNIIGVKKVPKNSRKIASVGHTIQEISKLILHNSDNFTSEVVFKVAASKKNNYLKEATLSDAIKIFEEFYAPYLSKHDTIADASGVSRENKLCLKTISNILTKLFKNENYKKLLPTANQGTMKERLIFLQDNLRAKTGSMRELSALTANFKTRNNTDIIFVSIVQDSPKRKSLLKNYENGLIGLIYKKY
ncbi:MAG: D-alanyl-D-alanine carboxypeptidase [Candidatus Gastranaerophilales bacterium]|nr:D-alanyl-D-alanine carboxypeptidase [Candidatus Gastranaerophilales bacterium]